MQKLKFYLKDLKIGQLVLLNNRDTYLVMPINDYFGGYVLVNSKGEYLDCASYNSDLTFSNNESFNIMAVYDRLMMKRYTLDFTIDDKRRKLLWKRQTSIEMTIEEIEEELGYPITIVNKESINNYE